MTTPTVYPLESPGREIADAMRANAANIRQDMRDGEYNFTRFDSTPGARYAVKQIMDCAEAASAARSILWQAAYDADNYAIRARFAFTWAERAGYLARSMEAAGDAVIQTANLIAWSVQVRPFEETARQALM